MFSLFLGKLNDKIDVAIKFALKDSEVSLKSEYLMYEKVGATSDIDCEKSGIPFIHYFGRVTHYYDVIIMTLLDDSIGEKFYHREKDFTKEYQLRLFIGLVRYFKSRTVTPSALLRKYLFIFF